MDLQEIKTEVDVLITEIELDAVRGKEVILNRLNTIKEEIELKENKICG